MNHNDALLPSNHEIHCRSFFYYCIVEDSSRQVARYVSNRELEVGELRLFSGFTMAASPPLLSISSHVLLSSQPLMRRVMSASIR